MRIQIGELFSDVNSKYGLLIAITAAFGMSGVVDGLFSLIAFGGMDIGWFVVGIILIVMAYIMTMNNEEANTVIWIILLIIYIIGIIISIILCLALIGIPMLLMFIMLITFLISPEVKSKMGM